MQQMLNKVPEVTIYFWLIKILCTTVGETAADYLNETLHFGLKGTSIVCGVLLVGFLIAQFRLRKYVPSIYWMVVVLVSVFGTLVTDALTDRFNVPLATSTAVFSVLLLATFVTWYVVERTLSVHSIHTTRREVFYWTTILFTFALGTAAGDLVAEKWDLGYLTSVAIFASVIALITGTHYFAKALLTAQHKHQSTNAVLAFWLAYIMTRPLGASIGDLLSSPRAGRWLTGPGSTVHKLMVGLSKGGGLGLGTTGTSGLFLALILGMVIFLTVTRKDVIPLDESDEPADGGPVAGCAEIV